MTAVPSGLTQPIEQESLLHRKPASHITVRVPIGTRQSYRKVKTGKAYFLNLPGMVLTTGAICENIIAITILFMLMYSLRTAVCPYAFNYRTNHCTDRTCYARTF